VLLSQLRLWTRQSLSLLNIPIYEWTDSTITLAWLKQHSLKWNIYVANRISEVQISSLNITWQYVSSKENPAGCASRVLSASMLSSHDLWWNGPPWLKSVSTTWPKRDPVMPVDATIAEEISAEALKTIIHHIDCASEWKLPQRYSSWIRLIRVIAYILRFIEYSK